jgi:hypothetical protein
MSNLHAFFQGVEASAFSQRIQSSGWIFPGLECAHLLALAVFGGSALLLDLRLLGWGLSEWTIPELARETRAPFRAGAAMLVASGGLLFASEAGSLSLNPAFQVKIAALAVASAFTVTVRRRVAGSRGEAGMKTRATALLSLLLWTVVAVAGRWAGFS